MKPDFLKNLRQTSDADPGCEACFVEFDQYIDAVLSGADAPGKFPQIVAHLLACDACREDAEGLIAALRAERNNPA